MIISIIQLKDENNKWITMYTHPDHVDGKTLYDRAIVEARLSCIANHWYSTYIRMVYATITNELTLRIDNEDVFEYTFDHKDCEEKITYIKQVRRDYSDFL